jgi:hypothetical protein
MVSIKIGVAHQLLVVAVVGDNLIEFDGDVVVLVEIVKG